MPAGPNIVFVFSDQHRAWTTGYEGTHAADLRGEIRSYEADLLVESRHLFLLPGELTARPLPL